MWQYFFSVEEEQEQRELIDLTADTQTDVTTDPTPQEEIESFVLTKVDADFRNTTIEQIEIHDNLDTEAEDDYYLYVSFIWTVQNKPSSSKELLSILDTYAQDFALTVGNSLKSVSEVTTYWTVPYSQGNNAYYYLSCVRTDSGMAITDKSFHEH